MTARLAPIRAAGGLLWRRRGAELELALVHRPRHRDWSLPKGKLEPGERFRDAALREVEEETGCRPRALGLAGFTAYLARGRPKIVLFWHMREEGTWSFAPTAEVDELAWLSRGDALNRLDHASERHLVRLARPPP